MKNNIYEKRTKEGCFDNSLVFDLIEKIKANKAGLFCVCPCQKIYGIKPFENTVAKVFIRSNPYPNKSFVTLS